MIAVLYPLLRAQQQYESKSGTRARILKPDLSHMVATWILGWCGCPLDTFKSICTLRCTSHKGAT